MKAKMTPQDLLDIEGFQLLDLIEAIDLAVWCSDANDRVVLYVSPAYERIWGRTREEFTSEWNAWRKWVHLDDAEEVFAASERFFNGPAGASYDLVYRILRPDGSVRSVHDRGFKLPGSREGIIHGVAADVTDARAEERELIEKEQRVRESESLYRNLIDLSPDMIAIHQDGRLVLMNQAGMRLLGVSSAEELVGREVLGFVHPKHRDRTVARITKLLTEGGTVPPAETTLVRPDGSEVEVEVSAAFCEFHGKPAIQLVGRDLTARRKAQSAARSIEANLAAVVNARADWVLAIDREGRIITANSATREAFRAYTGSELVLGTNLFDWLPEDPALKLRERLARALAGEKFRVEEPFDFRGTQMHLDISFAPVIEAGEPASASVICQDVTERVRTRRELEESGRRFRSLVEGLRLVAYEFDPKTRLFTYVSPLSENILGYAESEWYEPGFWRSALHPEDRHRISMYALNKERAGEDHEMEYRMIAADGSTVWIRDIVTVVTEDGRPIRLNGVLIDITERRKLEEQLLQSQKMEAIGRLAGGIAHDFNNMLSAIIGFAELLSMNEALPESAHRQITGIMKASNKAAALTGQLLTFARQQISRRELSDVNDLILSMSELLERLLGEAVEVKLDLATDLALVESDAAQLEQVLLNLALNARDAMPDGGRLEISTSNVHVAGEPTAIGTLVPGSYVSIRVRDDGEGMAPDVASRAFEPFFTTKPVGKGTGLGMAVCHGIIADHGGTIRLDTTPGKGTDVVLYLPFAYPRSTPGAPSGPFIEVKALVFDPDESQGERLGEKFRKLGCDTTVCSKVLDASRALGHGKFDLIALPEVSEGSGIERIVNEAQAVSPAIRVLYLGKGVRGGQAAAARSGETLLLHSPYRISDLARAVESLLEDH